MALAHMIYIYIIYMYKHIHIFTYVCKYVWLYITNVYVELYVYVCVYSPEYTNLNFFPKDVRKISDSRPVHLDFKWEK